MKIIRDDVHYEADRRIDKSGWQRVETHPYSGHYAFGSEQAAIDAARRVSDEGRDGYQVRRVRTTHELVVEVEPHS